MRNKNLIAALRIISHNHYSIHEKCKSEYLIPFKTFLYNRMDWVLSYRPATNFLDSEQTSCKKKEESTSLACFRYIFNLKIKQNKSNPKSYTHRYFYGLVLLKFLWTSCQLLDNPLLQMSVQASKQILLYGLHLFLGAALGFTSVLCYRSPDSLHSAADQTWCLEP